MIILVQPYGRTSNRFFQHIHLDSFCRQHGLEFYNPFLRDLYRVYPALKTALKGRCLQFFTLAFRKLQLFRMVKPHTFNRDDAMNGYLLLNKKLLFVEGWQFRSFKTTLKYRSFYQTLFDPAIDKEKYSLRYLTKKSPDQKTIAVHLRRGDYKLYNQGRYYFDDTTYISMINQLISQLDPSPIRILLFSNEKELNIESYRQAFGDVNVSSESEYVDYYLMSQCDFILGPPSTFSLWASYIGETPCYQFENTTQDISLADFKICSG